MGPVYTAEAEVDRFYLGKLLQDIAATSRRCFEDCFGAHLAYFHMVNPPPAPGDKGARELRLLYALKGDTPLRPLLTIGDLLATKTARFAGPDVELMIHFGDETPALPEMDHLLILIQCHQLHQGCDNDHNHRLAARLMDPEAHQAAPAPAWLDGFAPPRMDQMADEMLVFCARFLHGDDAGRPPIRDYAAAFDRMVNLVCHSHDLADWDQLVDQLPARFQEGLRALPDQWDQHQVTVDAANEQALVDAGRASVRFCQQWLEREAH